MKSAYELALERLESQGIERPRQESLSEETRQRLNDVRQQAAAKLAELEILHLDRLKTVHDLTRQPDFSIAGVQVRPTACEVTAPPALAAITASRNA